MAEQKTKTWIEIKLRDKRLSVQSYTTRSFAETWYLYCYVQYILAVCSIMRVKFLGVYCTQKKIVEEMPRKKSSL